MRLFDSHCHLEDERFAGETDALLARMKRAGVEKCICAGSDMPSCEKIVALAEARPMIYGMVGVHPQEADRFEDGQLERMAAWLRSPKIVGVGEIGLDYYYENAPRDVQKVALAKQLLFAKEQNVPVAFHIRDAHGDMLDLLRAHRNELPRGVLHCYSGSVDSAREYLDMGFYLSFAGPVTYKNAKTPQEAAAYCPLDRLLVETDSPYLAPVPLRGQRNEPSYVRYVAEKIAALRGVSVEALEEATWQNTCRLYRIPTQE